MKIDAFYRRELIHNHIFYIGYLGVFTAVLIYIMAGVKLPQIEKYDAFYSKGQLTVEAEQLNSSDSIIFYINKEEEVYHLDHINITKTGDKVILRDTGLELTDDVNGYIEINCGSISVFDKLFKR